jgi:hypothetical protein
MQGWEGLDWVFAGAGAVIATALLIFGLSGPLIRLYFREKRAHLKAMLGAGSPDETEKRGQ